MPRVFVPDESLSSPNVYVMNTYAPHIAKAAQGFAKAVYEGTKLPFRIVEAARLRTAQLNGCVTCQTFRAKRDLPASLGRLGGDVAGSYINRGDPEPDDAFYAALDDEWRNSPLFSSRERLAIEYAERMGTDPHSFDDDERFWEMMHADFADAEIVELTLCIACWMGLGRTRHVLDIDPAICAIAPA